MEKVSERIQISITKSDKDRLDELKEILKVNSYSKVIQTYIRYGKF